jgi:hypothetical protein
MTKTTIILMTTCILLIALSAAAFGNPYTLQAENGIIQPPTGLGFDLTSSFSRNGETTKMDPSVKASISYGAFSSITVTGEFEKSLTGDNIQGKMIKVYYSPIHEPKGYTVYVNYDLDHWEIPVYGVSLWLNTNHFLTYVNLQALTRNQPGTIPLTITPGANLNLGRLGMGAEVAIQPSNWSFQDLWAGISYEIVKDIRAKLAYHGGMNGNSDQGYQLGLSVEI